MTISRRALLGSLSLLLYPGSGRAEPGPTGAPVLVCVFLRGAADGLNIVVPHGEAEYYRLRPSLAVPPPGRPRGAIDLDGRFGLNPRLERLKGLFDAKELAVVTAVGSPHPTRSHFEAQDYMETGAVGNRSAQQGWLAAYLKTRPPTGDGVVRAVALSGRSPLALRGYRDAVIAEQLKSFRLSSTDALEPALSRGFRRLYERSGSRPAERAAQRGLEASELVWKALRRERRSKVTYARDARDFSDVAKLIKADVGLESAWIDIGGWDSHRQQGSTDRGELPENLDRLDRALAAFRADLEAHFERVAVLVMSEFGRTARENGTGGTDHGHGNIMLAFGGGVRGGRVLGNLPGLGPEHLFEGRDVPVTTDFRDVLAEVCERHLGLTSAAPLFPGYELQPRNRLGLFG
jgi:uncharacterized protein (DUF1501 family)